MKYVAAAFVFVVIIAAVWFVKKNDGKEPTVAATKPTVTPVTPPTKPAA